MLGSMFINGMAIPPIINHGNKYLKDLIIEDVI